MTEYDNTNRGKLFPKKDRKPDSNQPEYEGSADILCPHCNRMIPLEMGGWVKMMKDGVRRWLFISFKPREERAQSPATGETQQPAHNQQQQHASPQAAHPNVQDDLPF